MAAKGPEDRAGAGPGGAAGGPSGQQASSSTTPHNSNGPDTQQSVAEKAFMDGGNHKNESSVHLRDREAERGWSNMAAAPLPTVGPTMHRGNVSATRVAPYSFRSPESVEMDEIMAAMVLTSLSCSPVVQSPPQADPRPGGSSLSSADMECGCGELSDSGSSGCWSWDHGNGSPAPSPSVNEMDSSPDEGLNMELEQGDELNAKKPKSSFRCVYKCLWPSCGKVLTSSVGIKRHIRVLHLGSGSDQSQREEDFYYSKMSCETVVVDASSAPANPPQKQQQQAPLCQASCSHLSWALAAAPPPPCSSSSYSPAASELPIPPQPRPRSNSSSGPSMSRPSPLSHSAPSSFWQIHSEHLYQACNPVQVSVVSRNPALQGWTPSASAPVAGPSNTPMVKPRCRSVSVGEQWLQQNRLQPMSASPSRTHCSFKKGRGEAKKCRKVYGVERKDQWCTACRWKKACQRFPD